MVDLTLEQVLSSRMPATHPGPPLRSIQFTPEGWLRIDRGSMVYLLTKIDSGEPVNGWHHRSGCHCRFCRS